MDRKNKILMLTALQAGKLSIQDLQPKQLVQRIGINTPDRFKINGRPVDEELFNAELKTQTKPDGLINIEVEIMEYEFTFN